MFAKIPVAILGTSKCILIPTEAYRDRIFTTSIAKLPKVKHIEGYDYSPVIEKALSLPQREEKPENYKLNTGFSLKSMLGLADKTKHLVELGKIRHFFV